MTNFKLNGLDDIKKFCLCDLNNDVRHIFLNGIYVPIDSRVYVWKVLMCNKILNLINVDSDEYINELQNSTPTNILRERRDEIWNFMLPIYEKIKEYSLLNFKPSDVYLNMSNNGFIKEEINDILRNSGVHTWTAYITPVTNKFWVEGDFTFSEFIERVAKIGISEEWWDFHQKGKPVICDE